MKKQAVLGSCLWGEQGKYSRRTEGEYENKVACMAECLFADDRIYS